MITLVNEPTARVCSRYIRLLPWVVCAVLLLQAPLAWVGWPWNALLAWLGSMAAIGALSYAVWREALRGYPFPARTALLDARLLTDGSVEVRGVRCPLKETERPHMGAGSSALLLAYGAALLIDPDTKDAAERAVLDMLVRMKADRRLITGRCPFVSAVERDGLLWRVFRDGERERAYAMAGADALAPVCRSVWNGRAQPFAGEDRAALAAACASAGIPPLCVAMAEVENGVIGEAVYLGAFFFAQTLRADAQSEVKALRRAGLDVALRGTNPRLLMEMASGLGCSTICPDRNPLILTASVRGAGAEIPIVPERMSLSRETRLLMHIQRRLCVQPVFMGAGVTAVMLCCAVGGFHFGIIGLYAALLLLLTLPAFVRPAEPPRRSVRRTLAVLGTALLAAVITAKLCGDFFAACGYVRRDATALAALPALLALGAFDMRRASRFRPAAVAAICGACGATVLAVFLFTGTPVLPAVFALLAGMLAACPCLLWMRPQSNCER